MVLQANLALVAKSSPEDANRMEREELIRERFPQIGKISSSLPP
jgi:hypothetical protein